MDTLHARCWVCGVETSEREYRGRALCEDHLHLFWQDRPAFWRATSITLILMLAMVGGLGLMSALITAEPPGPVRLGLNLVVCLLPPLMWLGLTYRLRPIQGGFGALPAVMFFLAALLAAAIARPFLTTFINLPDWLAGVSPTNRFLGSILIAGSFHMLLLYGLTRGMTWRSPLFARRVDGVMLALAAAWGYSSALSVLFAVDFGGLTLLEGNLWLVARFEAYLAPSIVLGYTLARARFEDMPFYFLPAGMALAIGLNGALLYAGTALNSTALNLRSDGYSPWPGLVVSMVVLIAVTGAAAGLLRRDNMLVQARLEQTGE
jgi:hypothetical protein